MHFNKKYKNKTREVELDVCVRWDCWALPVFVSWWKMIGRGKRLNNFGSFDINLHVLCCSFHFTLWKWGK